MKWFASGVVMLFALAADAQQYVVSVRAGAMQVNNEAYEEIYGATTPAAGVAARIDFGRRWSAGLSFDAASKSGELIVFLPEPTPSGVEADVAIQTVNLTFGARLGPVTVIAGPTWLSLREETEFDRHTLSKFGGHLGARFERTFGSFLLGAEAAYVQIPNAFGEEGAPGAIGDTDFAAIAAHAYAGFRF